MARKRDEAIKANLAGWLDDAAAAEAADDASTAAPALDRAELARQAMETARLIYDDAAAGPTSTPAAPAQGAFPGGRRMVTAYLDAAEAAELEARAAAEERSVSFLVRRAVRAYLGMK